MIFVNKKGPTPQDLYRARKQKEEEERLAYLPPGLINHGNTCFMNSVLQGLIATPLLFDIVQFTLANPHIPVLSWRSPQLTNGHGHGGEYEKDWDQTMPLGDLFIALLEKAWNIQINRQRQCLSPKDILSKLGSKYDQYLDFRQQDAHELLRHLLDAMRMEEVDVIKRRQPPAAAKRKRKRVADKTESNLNDLTKESNPEPDHLMPFVDMVFGGQLASILVCERCKKVSCTYEDFNDLSLSIRREDTARQRKRDKLRSFARKWNRKADGPTIKPRSAPSSPVRRTIELEVLQQPSVSDVRRLSFDQDENREASDETNEISITVQGADNDDLDENSTAETRDPELDSDPPQERPEQEHVVWSEDVKDKELGKAKEKDSDPWTRLGRRISRSVKPKKTRDSSKADAKDESKQNENDKHKDKKYKRRSANDITALSFWADPIDLIASATSSKEATSFLSTPKSSTSSTIPHKPSPTPSRTSSAAHIPSPLVNNSPLLRAIPESQNSERNRHSSPLRHSSPYRPKLSREDTAFLRRILGDIPVAANPFTVFKPPGAPAEGASVSVSLWDKLGNVQSIEDCLRMFTAVEALDGENKVGCRRCYKIEHGLYEQRGRASGKARVCSLMEDDSSSESTSDAHESEQEDDLPRTARPPLSRQSTSSSVATANSIVPSLNSPSYNSNDHALEFVKMPPLDLNMSSESTVSPAYGGLPIPSISTTGPESPISARSLQILSLEATNERLLNGQVDDLEEPLTARPDTPLPISQSKDSLRLPATTHHHRHDINNDTSSISSDESADELESDASLANSILSDASSIARSRTTQTTSLAPEKAKQRNKHSDIPRSKQIIFQPSFKRYLIAKPPPVLVIHLKRFQQLGKTSMPFFSNFKKLDDFVRFPEFLDLQPFLIPKRENGKRGLERMPEIGVSKTGEKCMYRLYAVVVHIGNMLGGHYVAYTALPFETKITSEKPAVAEDGGLLPPAELPDSRAASFENMSRAKGKSSTTSQRQWCYISDTIVRLTTLEEVLKAKAYICMYERIYN